MRSVVEEVLLNGESLHRLVPSHFPPINLFEEVSDPADLEIVFAIESMTNDRLLNEAGDLYLVPQDQWVSGPGSTPLMAAFTHIGFVSRFTDGTQYGVYYAATDIKTAFRETIYHRERFLQATNEPDLEITMRCYVNAQQLPMQDIRGEEYSGFHGEDYAVPQAFAADMRGQGSNGFIYNSVRHAGGICIAAFNPKALTIPRQSGHYKYQWNGKTQRIENVLKVSIISI